MPSRLIIRTHLQLNYQTAPHSSPHLPSPHLSTAIAGRSTIPAAPPPFTSPLPSSLSLSLSIYLSIYLYLSPLPRLHLRREWRPCHRRLLPRRTRTPTHASLSSFLSLSRHCLSLPRLFSPSSSEAPPSRRLRAPADLRLPRTPPPILPPTSI